MQTLCLKNFQLISWDFSTYETCGGFAFSGGFQAGSKNAGRRRRRRAPSNQSQDCHNHVCMHEFKDFHLETFDIKGRLKNLNSLKSPERKFDIHF